MFVVEICTHQSIIEVQLLYLNKLAEVESIPYIKLLLAWNLLINLIIIV